MHLHLEDSRPMAEIAAKLRSLPTESQAPIPWKEFKRRQLLRRTRAHSAQRRQLALVAAVTAVMVGAVVLWKYLPPMQGTLAQRMVNASLPPGEWQTYDIVFEQPRFDGLTKQRRWGEARALDR